MTTRALFAKVTESKSDEFIRRLLWLCFTIALATPAFAQGFHFGVKVGVPMTEYFEPLRSTYSAATRRYTLGPSIEMRLWNSFGLELEVLYKRMGYVGITSNRSRNPPFITDSFDVKGNSWDFPLMVKYRFGRVVRPYVTGGGVVRYIGPVRARGVRTIISLASGPTPNTAVTVTTTPPIDTSDPFDLRKRIWPGLTVGGGIEFGTGRLRLLPEFRYTHWTSNITERFGTLRFNPNQAEFLLGFLF